MNNKAEKIGDRLNDATDALVVWPLVILSLLFLAAGLIPLSFMWGLNHLAYFPKSIGLVYAVLILVAFALSTSKRFESSLRNLSRSFEKTPAIIRIIVLAVMAAALFYLFRVHVHSLGDGYQRIYQIEQGYYYYHTEPLDFFAHGLLYRVLKFLGIDSGETTYVVFSIVTGVCFVLAVYLFRGYRKTDAGCMPMIKLLILTMGGMQLFFGYVESYALYYVATLLYLLWAGKIIVDGRGYFAAAAMLALALFSHITAIILVPSFAFIIYRHIKNKTVSPARRYLPAVIVLIPFLGIIIQEIILRIYMSETVPSISGGLLPLFSTSQYAIFSPAHVNDIINEFLLICPVPLVLAVALIRRKFDIGKHFIVFGLLAVVPAMLTLLLIDPKLGMARDWDLFSIPTAIIGMTILLMSRIGSRKKPGRISVKFLLIAISLIIFSSWILVNSSVNRQLERAEDLLTFKSKTAGYGTELLAYYYRFRMNDSQKALELLETIEGEARNARVYNKIAKMQIDLGRDEAALKSIYAGLRLDSGFTELHMLAGATWLRKGKPELSLPHFQTAVMQAPDRPECYQTLANTYFKLDSPLVAIKVYKKLLEMKPDHALAHFEIGNLYRLTGQYDSAFIYTREGLKLNPDFPNGLKLLEMIKAQARPSQRD